MCLITFAYKTHPKYELIFAANRDEEYQRPTRPAQFWDDMPTILAGKDLKAGGTWMGINKSGRFSALTNYRHPSFQKEHPPSRGYLVLNFLKNSDDATTYLQKVDGRSNQYMGFNLLAGTLDELGYYSNQQKKIELLEPGVYGLSNYLLNTPWPKVDRARTGLSTIINDDNISKNALFALLADDSPAPDDQLPDTGIPKEIEKMVSPVFIKGDKYGTRCSTVLLIDNEGKVSFEERRFKPRTQEIEQTSQFEFEIERE